MNALATKTQHRAFNVTETAEAITITEVEPKTSAPINWTSYRDMNRKSAWNYAQARGKRVTFVGRDGKSQELGTVFSPKAFEQAAYTGYVSYGCSMTDGHYSPLAFEAWVKLLRQHPVEVMSQDNDAAESVKAALPLYMEALVSVGV